MSKEEFYKEIDSKESITQRYLGLSPGNFFLLLILIVLFGIYLGIIFYGTNSLEVLFGLQDYENYLQDEVIQLENKNSELQREYFELKGISAQ